MWSSHLLARLSDQDGLDAGALPSLVRQTLLKSVHHGVNRSKADIIEFTLKRFTNLNWQLIILFAIPCLFSMTYIATSMQSALAMRKSKDQGARPPILPYWIPFVGCLITYYWDGPGLVDKLIEMFGQSVPAGLQLGPVKLYLVGDPDHIKVLFKPTPAISSTAGLEVVMPTVFGTPEYIAPIYSRDDSGPLPKPFPGSQVKPENRIRFLHTQVSHQHIAGIAGLKMGERYMKILTRKISANTVVGIDWVEMPDFWLFVRDLVFPCSTEAICGSSILSLNPTLTEDFWAFHRGIPVLLQHRPRWLSPGAYRDRDKMLDAIKKWHTFAKEHSDFSRNGHNDPDWDPYYGSRIVKARQAFLHDIEVMDADGRASEDLGLLFAASANSIIVAFWAMLEIISRPGLLQRVREIVQSALDSPGEVSECTILGSNPLLQSIFAETTRLRVVGIIPRTVVGGDFQLGKWSIPQGSLVGLSSRAGALNKDVWNVGTESDPHPLEEFWEERFLTYPENPYSGPLRKHETTSNPKREKLNIVPETSKEPQNDPTFSLQGLQGAYIPFGGGLGICPGRHFAKQEVVCTIARFVLKYDVVIQASTEWRPKMDTAFFPQGSLPPKDRVPFMIRRRSSISIQESAGA